MLRGERSGIRRSAVVAVLALVAGVALVACGNTQPGTAAYVAGKRYTEKQVDELVDQIRASALGAQIANPRVTAVSYLVLGDLARRAAAERSIQVPPSDYSGAARSLAAPAESALVRAVADLNAAGTALTDHVVPVMPADKDFREIYDVVRRNPNFPADTTYEQVVEELRTDASLPQVIGVRNVLREQAVKNDVVVNPRYRPLVANIGGGVPLVLAEGSDVVDAETS